MKHKIFLFLLLIATAFPAAAQTMQRGHVCTLSPFDHETNARQPRAAQSLAVRQLVNTGSPYVPLLLVQFPDRKFSVAADDAAVHDCYHQYANLTHLPAGEGLTVGSPYGSVADYFAEQSDSIFLPIYDIIGPITLDEGYAYYGGNNPRQDARIKEFFTQACVKAVTDFGTDWTKYDNDDNGIVDFVFFVFAGVGENDGSAKDPDALWPSEYPYQYTVQMPDGAVTFGGYGCCNELYGGKQDGIGTMVHETCHGLGFPDFYDRTHRQFGMDSFSPLDAGYYGLGGMSPSCFTAYEREYMGWRTMEELPWSDDAHYSLTLYPYEQFEAVAYKIVNPANPNECFTFENRQNIPGSFDAAIGCWYQNYYDAYGPVHGLQITHVNYIEEDWQSNNVNTDMVYGTKQDYTIVPADGELIGCYTQGLNEAYHTSLHGDLYPGNKDVHEMTSYAVATPPYREESSLKMRVMNIEEAPATGIITMDIYLGDAADNPDVDGIHSVLIHPQQNVKRLIDNRIVIKQGSNRYDIFGKKVGQEAK